jgi:uncharacterized membrane protein
MASVVETIDIDVPVMAAYAQWTRLEDLPLYTEGVTQVKRLDGRRSQWRANILGCSQEWEAEIVQQVPDRWVVWRSTSGAEHNGSITFQWLGPAKTRVTVRIEYQPQGFLQKLGDILGAMEGRVYLSLKRFKRFMELRQPAEVGVRASSRLAS